MNKTISCDDYERLLEAISRRELTDDEIKHFIEHNEACPSGRHSIDQVEKDLGLPKGALEHGDPDSDFRSAAEIKEKFLMKLPEWRKNRGL